MVDLDDMEAKAKAALDGSGDEDGLVLMPADAVLELIERVRTAERTLAQYHKSSPGYGLGSHGC